MGRAIRDWADSKVDKGEIINRYFLKKIQFYGTDIPRFAFAAMRQAALTHIAFRDIPCGAPLSPGRPIPWSKAQYIESLCPISKDTQTWHRCEINAWEMMAAVHLWLRQVALHCGYYLFMLQSESKVAAQLLFTCDQGCRGPELVVLQLQTLYSRCCGVWDCQLSSTRNQRAVFQDY